ncbi:MAG TPA: BON domain-containing protein [Chloroflexota bacterium]|nr:BON domain-containing protein [Chloroflexota bacterium]
MHTTLRPTISPRIAAAHDEPARARATAADRELALDVIRALVAKRLLHPVDDLLPPPVRIDAHDGTVTLQGNVSSRERAGRMVHAAQSVAGVQTVRDELFADEELDAAITRALAAERRLRADEIDVTVREGVVLLSGTVRSPEVARAAVEVAAAADGVRVVAPHLGLPGEIGVPHSQVVVLPRIGSRVTGAVEPIGWLRYVVVALRTRRVTHLVVAARFPTESALWPGQPQVERLVLVPVEAVSLVTHDLVRLHLGASGLGELPVFDENAFAHPPSDWAPPIDYEWDDVRVAVAPGGAGRS